MINFNEQTGVLTVSKTKEDLFTEKQVNQYFPIKYSREEVLNILDKFLESMLKGEKTGLIEEWFDETYGSKGSDEPIELLCSTVEVGKSYLSKGCGIGEVIEYDSIIQMFKVKYQSGNTEYVNLYGLATHVNNITATDFDLMLDKPTSSQTEISDEEIEKAVNEYANVYQCTSELKMCKHDVISAWNNAIKWYREQLKQRQ